MILHKHPQLMTEKERCDWAIRLMRDKTPESKELDYKETIVLENQKERLELAKDVSSFANERGGVLLYGVPEAVENGVPIPADIESCGIEVAAGLPEKVENILLDVIEPPLPELFIKILTPSELGGKSLLMIYHPESYCKPHMVEKYKDGHYYRRQNYRSSMMDEKEVEASYLARRVSLSHADDFFAKGDFGPIFTDGPFWRAIVCPRFMVFRKEAMMEEQFKDWLTQHHPANRNGTWRTFVDGWAFHSHPTMATKGTQYELRIFHNGAVCLSSNISLYKEFGTVSPDDQNAILDLGKIIKDLTDLLIPFAGSYFERMKISGPVAIRFCLHSIRKRRGGFMGAYGNNEDAGTNVMHKDRVEFTEEFSSFQVQSNPDDIVERIDLRLRHTFAVS